MIKHLLKHDLKKMLRILVYIYIVTIGLAVITRLINLGKDIQTIAIIGSVFSSLVYSAIASILINTVVHILAVFIGKFYRDESYLTHTLPVSKSKLLLSKYLASLIVILTSVIVSVLSLFIILYTPDFWQGLTTMLEMSLSGFDMSVGGFLTLIGLLIFAQICAMMSMSFCAIVVANRYNSKRVLKGVLWFFLFYMASMWLTFILAVVVFSITGNLSVLFANVLSQSALITLIVLVLVLYVVYAVVFYIISNKLFNKGVNVD